MLTSSQNGSITLITSYHLLLTTYLLQGTYLLLHTSLLLAYYILTTYYVLHIIYRLLLLRTTTYSFLLTTSSAGWEKQRCKLHTSFPSHTVNEKNLSWVFVFEMRVGVQDGVTVPVMHLGPEVGVVVSLLLLGAVKPTAKVT